MNPENKIEGKTVTPVESMEYAVDTIFVNERTLAGTAVEDKTVA